MIVFRFDDDLKFPLVSSLTTAGRAVRLEIVAGATQRSLRIVTTVKPSVRDAQHGATIDARADIVLALPLNAVDGEPERIELEVNGETRFCEFYVEGSDDIGVGVVWKLSGEKQNGASGTPLRGAMTPTVVTAAVAEPHERWDRNGDDPEQYGASGTPLRGAVAPTVPPLIFHRLRIAVAVRQDIDIVLRELRVSGDVHIVPAGLSDS